MSNALAAISLITDLTGLLVNVTEAVRAAGSVVGNAAAEGRDVSREELDTLRQVRARVLIDLDDEIRRRQAIGG